jgi:hypothetical protein
VVSGDSGSGISALLSSWFLYYRDQHPNDVLLAHFVGATPNSINVNSMLHRIMCELKRHFLLLEEVPTQANEIRKSFPMWLARVVKEGRITLLLDGLQQLEDWEGVDLRWLPTLFPPHCRLILSTLPGRSLDAIRDRHWPELTVQPLTVSERKELVEMILSRYSKRLDSKLVSLIASAPQTANSLFLELMLDELRQFGDFNRLQERIAYYLTAYDVKQLYELIFARWEDDYGYDLVCNCLTYIWASRIGLSEVELLDLLGSHGQPLARSKWFPFFIAAESIFIERSGLLSFSNLQAREATCSRYLPTSELRRAAHFRLVEYFNRQEPTPRIMAELRWQKEISKL